MSSPSTSGTTKRVTIKDEPEEIPPSNSEPHQRSGHITWDTEEVDYLLSHFVEGSSNGHSASSGHPEPLFATSFSIKAEADNEEEHDTSDDEAKFAPPPSTPAVQFYHTSHREPLPSEVTSSSLSSMAASLVNGGPVLQQQQGLQQHPSLPFDRKPGQSESPISPAAMIGEGQEHLMLPPAPQYPPSAAGAMPQQASAGGTQQETLAFLNHINTMARMAAVSGNAPAPPSSSMNHPGIPPQHPQHAILPPQWAQAAYNGASHLSGGGGRPPESEEKRKQRLARNRESARNSRRRKKELLHSLGAKVSKLYNELEEERRRCMDSMEPALWETKQRELQELVRKGEASELSEEDVRLFLEKHSPNRSIRQAVLHFQYATWKQLLLPKYEAFVLWWTIQPEDFFLKGKEEKANQEQSSPTAKTTTGKVSSKQIGKEITKKWESTKTEDQLTCDAQDAPKTWPLLCFELEVGVEQEDKLLQAHKDIRQKARLPRDRAQMEEACRLATNMGKGMRYQCHAAAMRSETALLKILTPTQSIRFLEWFAANRERCRETIERQRSVNRVLGEDTTLSDLSRRLDEALRLPQSDTSDDGMN